MHNLWQAKPWDDLVTDVTCDLSANAYTFPVNFGRIIDVWGDLNGTGVPSYWYYAADVYEKGYKLRDSFTKATGHTWIITFYWPQPAPVKMRYQRLLEEFTGTGTEYSFFPANLLLLECQRINTLEKGNVKEWQAVVAEYDRVFKDYCNAHQWVNADPLPRMNDRLGHELMMEGYSLDGSGTRPFNPMPPGYIQF
jgi:hypothetical protein